MRLTLQKKLASQLLRASRKRVRFNTERIDEIKEAITKVDIKGLISDRAIIAKQKKGVSRVRVNKKRNSLKKGKFTARQPPKRVWIKKVRALRVMIKILRDKDLITTTVYRNLYLKVKGGFFRTKRHLRLYVDEKKLLKKEPKKAKTIKA